MCSKKRTWKNVLTSTRLNVFLKLDCAWASSAAALLPICACFIPSSGLVLARGIWGRLFIAVSFLREMISISNQQINSRFYLFSLGSSFFLFCELFCCVFILDFDLLGLFVLILLMFMFFLLLFFLSMLLFLFLFFFLLLFLLFFFLLLVLVFLLLLFLFIAIVLFFSFLLLFMILFWRGSLHSHPNRVNKASK